MRIKICGLFREQDIEYVNEARPDYSGFVFAQSRRQVSAGQARKLRSRLADGIVSVGVFVDSPVEEIADLYRGGVISIAQLHGDEDEAYIARLKEASGGVPVIKVIKAADAQSLRSDLQRYASGLDTECFPLCGKPFTKSDYILIDSGAGSGKTFDWNFLNSQKIEKPWFLAGGINSGNIEQAMMFNPFAVDVSGGAETDGLKDREKILRLVKLAHKEK